MKTFGGAGLNDAVELSHNLIESLLFRRSRFRHYCLHGSDFVQQTSVLRNVTTICRQ